MTAPVFVDSNVLIYALDPTDASKQARAKQWRGALWEAGRGRVSYQVLQEFFYNIGRRWPTYHELAKNEVRDLLEWRPIAPDGLLFDAAWRIQDQYRSSFWDAMIVAAAQRAECRYLLTEDLQDGQVIEGVTVISPFSHEPEQILA